MKKLFYIKYLEFPSIMKYIIAITQDNATKKETLP